MEWIHTDGSDERFVALCRELDDFLNEAVGGEKQREQYNQYNTLENIHDVVLLIDGNQAVGCGGFKEYEPYVAEIKRVFVRQRYRKQGLAKSLMNELEALAKQKGYRKLILETGAILEAAMKLYSSIGFCIIDNYGQYANMPESVCMEKIL